MTERAERILLLYIVALPFHSLLLALLLTAGVPILLLKGLSAWKEVLLILLFLAVLLRVLENKTAPRLCWVDGIALLWLAQLVVYCVLGGVFFDANSTVASRCFAARDWALYLFPYFIGRFTILTESGSKRVFRALVIIGFLTSLIGIIEYVFVPTSWHVTLGVPRYFSQLLGLQYPDYVSGLPFNYWAEVAGLPVRRAVSVYLSGQGFALPFLLIWPAVLVANLKKTFVHAGWIVASCGLALMLTITRMTIAACFVETIVFFIVIRNFRALSRMILAAALVFIMAVTASSSFRDFVVSTMTMRDTSSSARPSEWRDGIRQLEEHSLGDGLTAVGQASLQTGGSGIGQEAGYLKVINAFGVPGTIIYLGWFAGVLLKSKSGLGNMVSYQEALCMVCLLSTVGFLINNLAAPPDQAPVFIYPFSWLAGLAVQRSVENSPVPAPSFDRDRTSLAIPPGLL